MSWWEHINMDLHNCNAYSGKSHPISQLIVGTIQRRSMNMKQISASRGRGLILGVLIILISLTMVGTAAAGDNDMMDSCRQLAAGNETLWYGPGMMSAGNAQMMESVEVSAMGGPMHDEMQGLVTKMMAGSLTSSDQARMVEIMNKYPGASNMMMTRMIGGKTDWAGAGTRA